LQLLPQVGSNPTFTAGEIEGRKPSTPKEQPPRKLSGKRTVVNKALWRVARIRPLAHRRSKPKPQWPG